MQVKSFVDGLAPVGDGEVLEAFLDGEDGFWFVGADGGFGGAAGFGEVVVFVRAGEHFGAVGVEGRAVAVAEGFGAAHV